MLRIIRSVRIPVIPRLPVYFQTFSTEPKKVGKAHNKNSGKGKNKGEAESPKDASLENLVKFYDAILESSR